MNVRLIITFNCNRDCSGCCNSYTSVMQQLKEIKDIKELEKYDKIIITGGEPNLYIEEVEEFLKIIKKEFPNKIIYFYTAFYSKDFKKLYSYLDGIQFSIHEKNTEYDLLNFPILQKEFQELKKIKKISLRLYIDNKNKNEWNVDLNLWDRYEKKDWYSEEEIKQINKGTFGIPIREELRYFDLLKYLKEIN